MNRLLRIGGSFLLVPFDNVIDDIENTSYVVHCLQEFHQTDLLSQFIRIEKGSNRLSAKARADNIIAYST